MPKMGTAQRKEAMIAALHLSLGVVKTACEKVKLARGTHNDWFRHDPEYRAKVEEVYEVQLDFVESSFLKAIRDGSVPAMIHYLKNKGKKRGYSEVQKIEQTNYDGGKAKIVIGEYTGDNTDTPEQV